MKVNGTMEEPVYFDSDRLEAFYSDLPGQWDRIWLNEGSVNNEINYAVIRNGFIGIQAETLDQFMGNQLTISNSIIENMSGAGILTRYYFIAAANCVIASVSRIAWSIIPAIFVKPVAFPYIPPVIAGMVAAGFAISVVCIACLTRVTAGTRRGGAGLSAPWERRGLPPWLRTSCRRSHLRSAAAARRRSFHRCSFRHSSRGRRAGAETRWRGRAARGERASAGPVSSRGDWPNSDCGSGVRVGGTARATSLSAEPRSWRRLPPPPQPTQPAPAQPRAATVRWGEPVARGRRVRDSTVR